MEKLLQQKADEVIEVIKNSDVYIRYQSLLVELKKDDEMYGLVNEYRKDNMHLMTVSNDEWIRSGGEMIDRYRNLFNNDAAREFLALEDDLCRLLWKFKECIYESIDMDLDFLD